MLVAAHGPVAAARSRRRHGVQCESGHVDRRSRGSKSDKRITNPENGRLWGPTAAIIQELRSDVTRGNLAGIGHPSLRRRPTRSHPRGARPKIENRTNSYDQ